MPGYLENQDALKALDIDEVIFYCVNDGAVMKAWFVDQKLENSMMQMFGDPSGEFTYYTGMRLDHDGPRSKGLFGRCKRYAMFVENCVVRYVAVSESEDDPAGDDNPGASCVEAMLEAIGEIRKKDAEEKDMEEVEEPAESDSVEVVDAED